MLTRVHDLVNAAARLRRLGVPDPAARAIVVQTLELGSWEQAQERAQAGTLRYGDQWLVEAVNRYDRTVRGLINTGALDSRFSGLLQISLLDIFQVGSGLSAEEVQGLGPADLIRRVAAEASPYRLIMTRPSAFKAVGPHRKAQKVVGGLTYDALMLRAQIDVSAKLRADQWQVSVTSVDGPLGVLSGTMYTPLDRKGVAGERALLAVDAVSDVMFFELLPVIGSLPGGRLTAPTATIDSIYVVPRARGQRLGTAMATFASEQLQRLSPSFGLAVIAPSLLLHDLQFPAGVTPPSGEDLRRHLDHHFLLPMAKALHSKRVELKLRGRSLMLGPEQALHLVGELSKGASLGAIEIPPEEELVRQRSSSPFPFPGKPTE